MWIAGSEIFYNSKSVAFETFCYLIIQSRAFRTAAVGFHIFNPVVFSCGSKKNFGKMTSSAVVGTDEIHRQSSFVVRVQYGR